MINWEYVKQMEIGYANDRLGNRILGFRVICICLIDIKCCYPNY
jgi:hypothetical protein